MPLGFPAPRTWEDGEDAANTPTAADLNLDWRDALSFLLGTDKPMFRGFNTSNVSLSSTMAPITYTVTGQADSVKRGFTHTDGDSKVYVPFAGRYMVAVRANFSSAATANGRLWSGVRVSTVDRVITEHHPLGGVTGGGECHMATWVVSCTAGQYIEHIQGESTTGTGVTTDSSSLSRRSMLSIWLMDDGG